MLIPLSKITSPFIKFHEKLKFETAAVVVCMRMLFELFDKFVAEAVLKLSWCKDCNIKISFAFMAIISKTTRFNRMFFF